MARRLVIDMLQRTRLMYLWMFSMVLLIWIVEGVDNASPTMGLTISLMMAYAIGPIAAITTGALREIRILPVTNRELWLATCTTSSLVGPLFLLVVQSLAIGGVYAFTGSTGVAPETVLLVALYAFAYAGALLPVGPLLGYASGNVGSRRPRWLWIALSALAFLIFVGGFGLPFLFAAAVPLTVDQFTLPTITILAVCLAITGATWTWTPKRGGIVRPNQAAQRAGARTATRHWGQFADRFTGIARIAWSHASLTVVASTVTIAGFVVYWAVFDSSEGLRPFMQNAALLPFDTSFQLDQDGLGDWTVLLVFFFVASNGVWNPLARQLKALPITVRVINLLMVLTPLVTWMLIWIVLIVTHRIVCGAFPDAIRPEMLVFVCGTSALGHMLALRFKRGSSGFQWYVVPLGMMTSILSRTIGATPTPQASLALAAAGFAALGIAAVVNHRTLTRSTSSANAYQRYQLPLGLIGPGARQ